MRMDRDIEIQTGAEILNARLIVPEQAEGVVIFAHGSGSGRHSQRNRQVAEWLHTYRLATLLADLLTPGEEEIDRETRKMRFNIPLLAKRVSGLAEWVQQAPELGGLQIGYFGASTGAAAALISAAERPALVQAVVSRGGRVDLADAWLGKVLAPTLLIVGERDEDVLELNRRTLERLRADATLEVIPAATHLFTEPGTLERVAHLAGDWFHRHLKQHYQAIRV